MKKGVLVLLAFVFAFTSLSFASAAVNLTSPASGTNYSSSNGGFVFNVSFINGTDLPFSGDFASNLVNASLYTESAGTRTLLTNSSACGFVLSSQIVSCWGHVNVTSSNDGFFNLSVQVFNATSDSINSSTNISSIYFDSSVPEVLASNFTSPLSGRNYSEVNTGLLKLNISLVDVTIGLQSVFFNVTNSSGDQNATYFATREGSSDTWSVSINTTHFPDGTYNITVSANDSLNNVNGTSLVNSLIFDNTAPTAAFSCSPSSVAKNALTTCTCTPSDATSGVDSSLTTSGLPSSLEVGTFSLSCSFGDLAGNTASTSTTYTITSITSSGGSGGGSSGSSSITGWKTTFVGAQAEFESSTGYTKSVAADQRIKLIISGENHHVGVKSISGDKVTVEVASDPQTVEMAIGQTKKFEINGDNLYDIQVTLNSITSGKADLTIKKISEERPAETTPSDDSNQETTADEEYVDPDVASGKTQPQQEVDESSGIGTVWWVLIVIAVLLIIWFVLTRRK